MDINELGYWCMNWIKVTHNKVQLWHLKNKVINFPIPK